MKIRTMLVIFILVITSGISGFSLAINIFAINIDVLGLPYKNTPVKTIREVVIIQNEKEIKIPKGSTILYGYTAKNLPFYRIEFYGTLFDNNSSFVESNNRNYFQIKVANNERKNITIKNNTLNEVELIAK